MGEQHDNLVERPEVAVSFLLGVEVEVVVGLGLLGDDVVSLNGSLGGLGGEPQLTVVDVGFHNLFK